MAIVRVSGVLLGIGMLVLAGCDIFRTHGPDVANTLDVPLEVIVRHADGYIWNVTLKPGMFVGIAGEWEPGIKMPIIGADLDKDQGAAIPIEELVIKEAGQTLHQFNAEAVRLLIEKQDSDWGWWCIDRERVYLAHSPKTYPDARKECSKGKRLWTWENGRFMEDPAGPD